jgi:GNAT superfamily N-acetyltransferase
MDFEDTLEDAYVEEEAEPAPEQVTYRLHELRAQLEAMADHVIAPWHILSDEAREVAFVLGEHLTEAIVNDPESVPIAKYLHLVRQYLDPALADWLALQPEERRVGEALMEALLDWLELEGTVHRGW